MSHNRDLSAAAAQLGFHNSNIGIGSEAPRYPLDVYNGNLLVSGSSAGNLILEDRGVGDSSRPFHIVSSDGGKFVINRSNRNASGTTTSSVNSLTLNSSGNLGLGQQTSPAANIHIGDISGGYELKVTGNALQFNRSSNSYIDQLHDTGSLLFRMTSSNTEAMRITSAGRMGVGCTPETDFQVRNGNGGTIKIGGSGTSATGLEFQYNNSGTTTSVIKTNYRSTNANASLKIDTGTFIVTTGTSGTERLRITSDGKFGFNTSNPGAFDSGANHFVLLGNTSGTGNAGITIASGTDSHGNIYFADGTSGADAYRGTIAYNHNGNTMRFGTNGSERVRILSSGHVNIGGYLTSVSNSGLHVGRGSGGTAAGESVLAATLGDHSTMVSALLTVKNAGNRGAAGATGGSPLAKFEFNNGTAFEVNKSGQVTTPYQPSFKAKLSAATGANHSGVLVFNSVSFNVGGHYNSSNGRFTAPVDGRYLFAWYDNIEASGTTAVYVDWMINGNVQGNRIYTMRTTGWEGLAGSIIFDLNTNDYVQIYAYSSGNYDGGQYGAFSGCLLG